MIEPIMYAGLGFLVASLLGLITVPLVHARAVRLTTRRLEAVTPLSMAEIQADKDQLRAEFAMSTRRLEISVDQLKRKTTGQLAELGQKTDAINRLKLELNEKTATIFSLEAREKALRDQLRTTEDELSAKTGALRDAEQLLAEKESELAKLAAALDDRSVTADGQKVEIAALRAQVDSLKATVTVLENDVKETQERLAHERLAAEAAGQELADERGQVKRLGERIAQLELQLAAQTAEAENLARRVTDLETRLSDQSKLLAERERERDQLRLDLEATRKIEADLRQELTTSDRRYGAAAEAMQAEKVLLETMLDRARDDRAKLQREVATMKRDAEAAWAAERVENAMLRERINDVAAEVARMSSALEGPGSPIEAILSQDTTRQLGNGTPKPAVAGHSPGEDEARGSLADRIRALQTRASQLSSA